MTDSPRPNTNEYLIEDILPAREVHLISGPSGAGKTILAIQMTDDWYNGRPIFGHASYPGKFCYVSCMRSVTALRRELTNQGIDPAKFPHLSLLRCAKHEQDRTVELAVQLARDLVPGLKLLILDGMEILCPGKTNDLHDVSVFLIKLAELCQDLDITIIGIVYASKARQGETYISVRDRVAGSAAWQTTTSSKFIIESSEPDNAASKYRRFYILPQHQEPTILKLEFGKAGRLIECNAPWGKEATKWEKMTAWLAQQPRDTEISSQLITQAATQFGMSKAAKHKWMNDMIPCQLILVSKGNYRTPLAPVPEEPYYASDHKKEREQREREVAEDVARVLRDAHVN